MKPIASRSRSRARKQGEAGFTLTEMVAGLLVASMLIVGLADITRRYALTTLRVRDAGAELRTAQVVRVLFSELKRIDPDSLDLAPERMEARIGSQSISARLTLPAENFRMLEWSSPAMTRSIAVPRNASFETTASGAIVLWGEPAAPPLAVVTPARTARFDCQFDTVTKACR